MIDGGVAAHSDLNIYSAPVTPTVAAPAPGHATHVAGIMGAQKTNSLGTRGVNPNDLIVDVLRGDANVDWVTAFDWVLADTESQGVFGILNFSSNGPGFDFTNGTFLGFANRIVRSASNRVLVVNSAGNELNANCTEQYNFATNANDGILVVGGIDANGQQGVNYNNRSAYGPTDRILPGSNWGPCVEVWAPSTAVFSTWSTSSTAIQSLSGTSMAAPHVAGLAARYGSSTTSPAERENYIRAHLTATGFNDAGSVAIKIPDYTTSPLFTIAGRVSPSYIDVSGTASPYNKAYAADGLYLNSFWSSGGAAPQWIEYDLGAVKTVKAVRLTPEMSPAGPVTHKIYVDNSTPATNLVATISDPDAASLSVLTASFSATGRYVRVETTVSPSWVGWREVEVIGY